MTREHTVVTVDPEETQSPRKTFIAPTIIGCFSRVALLLFLLTCLLPSEISAQVQTRSLPKACSQYVYVQDGYRIRKLHRPEVGHTKPGTGTWGKWQEVYCETPAEIKAGVARFFITDWPKPISQKEVKRLLGTPVYQYFDKHRKVTTTETWNLTKHRIYDRAGPGIKKNFRTRKLRTR